MKNLSLLCALGLLFVTVAACADTPYFYGGDFGGNQYSNAILNENIGDQNPYTSATYQNFYALSDITVRGLFTNNFSNLNPSSGYWELRSGVSEGNGGALIASGTGAVTNTPTGRNFFGYDEYTNLISGLGVSLATGQYWFAVVPLCPTCDSQAAYNGNTFGLNSIGKSDLDLEYYNSPNFGINFRNPNDNDGQLPYLLQRCVRRPGGA